MDDATGMEESRSIRPSGSFDGLSRPGSGHEALQFVEELERRLRSLCGTVDSNDARALRDLVRSLRDSAQEEVDCDFIGIEDDGLLEEMELSAATERVEDLIAFCRAAMTSSESAGDPEPGSDEA